MTQTRSKEYEDCLIRQARKSDLREIYLIEIKSFPYPYPVESLASLLILFPRYFFVAECGGRVVGYVAGALNKDGSGHIMSIAILPSYRGRGLGSRLMDAIENAFRREGISRVYLEVSQNNKVALNLYRKRGFKVISMRESYYPDGSDAYIMFKEIRD
jgi:ribosomal-protein-alanine N-acetyltransferase